MLWSTSLANGCFNEVRAKKPGKRLARLMARKAVYDASMRSGQRSPEKVEITKVASLSVILLQ